MAITKSVHGEILVARVEDSRIDAAGAVSFKDEMVALMSEPQKRVVLDLQNVEFLDSSGLGAVVAVMKAYGAEMTLELAALNPIVEKVLRLTRMDKVFRIHSSADTALAA
ncbi:MAG: STAS domain-containing protein [Dinoroseobacter sp.]|nr:STAS domain-containing protein [Dinoroseobacter sp.]MDJ0993387.1 STAS domain-containing protein [Dinoroseobacter sp.]